MALSSDSGTLDVYVLENDVSIGFVRLLPLVRLSRLARGSGVVDEYAVDQRADDIEITQVDVARSDQTNAVGFRIDDGGIVCIQPPDNDGASFCSPKILDGYGSMGSGHENDFIAGFRL